ncbi:MAG: alpha/beta hydrolase [Bacteroidota bacterium]
MTFYDPKVATKELVDEVYGIVNNRIKAIKIIALAKSAIRNNVGEELNQIKQPTLLIWGNNDSITPPFVAKEFNKLIPNSELHFIDKCGHAPMMEVPDEFNSILLKFLKKFNEPCNSYMNAAVSLKNAAIHVNRKPSFTSTTLPSLARQGLPGVANDE